MPETVVRLVDDDRNFLESQKYFLQMAGYTVATYESCLEFLERDDFRKPGCLVLDLNMPGMMGTDLQKILSVRGSRLPIIFLSAHGDINTAVRAVKNGACDFLEKPADPEQLLDAIAKSVEVSLAGEREKNERGEMQVLWDSLTAREQEVLRLVATGMTNREVGEELGIQLPTVKMHRARALAKVGVRSTIELDAFLRKLGGEG